MCVHMCVRAHTCFKLHVHGCASTQAHTQRVKGRMSGIFLCHPPPYITETESICWTYCFAKCWDFGHLGFVQTHSVLPAHWAFELRSWGLCDQCFYLHSLLSSSCPFSLSWSLCLPSMVTGDCSPKLWCSERGHRRNIPSPPLGLSSLIIRRKSNRTLQKDDTETHMKLKF